MNKRIFQMIILIAVIVGTVFTASAAGGSVTFTAVEQRGCKTSSGQVVAYIVGNVHLVEGESADLEITGVSQGSQPGPFDYSGVIFDNISIALDANQMGSVVVTVFDANAAVAQASATFNCQGKTDGDAAAVSFSGSQNGSALVNDGRINGQTYSPTGIYCRGAGFDVYAIDGSSEGSLVISVSADNLPTVPSAADTLVQQAGNIRLYRLTSGEFQLNVGPDASNKEYITIWDGCPQTYVHNFTLENGVLNEVK